LQKGKTPCERQLPTAAFMRVLTYCVTAAPGAAQALRRGFAGHITLIYLLGINTLYSTRAIQQHNNAVQPVAQHNKALQ